MPEGEHHKISELLDLEGFKKDLDLDRARLTPIIFPNQQIELEGQRYTVPSWAFYMYKSLNEKLMRLDNKLDKLLELTQVLFKSVQHSI